MADSVVTARAAPAVKPTRPSLRCIPLVELFFVWLNEIIKTVLRTYCTVN